MCFGVQADPSLKIFALMSRSILLILTLLAFCAGCDSAGEEDEKVELGMLYVIQQSGSYGYINVEGQVVITPRFDLARTFSEGRGAFRGDQGRGFLDTKGDTAIVAQFDDVRDFSEGLAAVRIGSSWGFIDKSGSYVINPILGSASSFSEGLAGIGNNSFIDQSGEIVVNLNQIVDNLIAQVSEKKFVFDGISGIRPSPPLSGVGVYSDGLARANAFVRWGLPSFLGGPQVVDTAVFVDRSGRVVLSGFDTANSFSDGLAAVGVRDGHGESVRIGYINIQGSFVISPTSEFESASEFYEGLAAVKVGRVFGYIDRQGEIVIEPQFSAAGPFIEGLAQVRVDGRIGYINKDGRYIYNPTR